MISLILFDQYFDRQFVLSWVFISKTTAITAVSCLPLYIVKALRRKFSPPSYAKVNWELIYSKWGKLWFKKKLFRRFSLIQNGLNFQSINHKALLVFLQFFPHSQRFLVLKMITSRQFPSISSVFHCVIDWIDIFIDPHITFLLLFS